LELWKTPPFQPAIRDGQIYARGAMDNKGQIFCHIKGVESLLRETGELPVDVLFLIEGEEEVGSRNLAPFVRAHRRQLNADVCVISDSSMYGPNQPAISFGLRGVICLELRVHGPSHDLHSGMFGGTIMNPAVALAKVLGEIIDSNGSITIPGFYDDVRPLNPAERRQLASLPSLGAGYQRMLGVRALAGERGYTVNERRWARPSFDINGIFGGYQAQGSKTVIPAWAGAKFSFRLVPNQTPARVIQLIRRYLRKKLPAAVRWELLAHELGAEPYLVSTDGPYFRAASRALEKAFGRKPYLIREGGSIPIVTTIKKVLGLETILIGLGLADDGAHSPNEHFGLDRLRKGILASRHLLQELAVLRNG
jgi:succinyl-diaminopimelate desuccinylase